MTHSTDPAPAIGDKFIDDDGYLCHVTDPNARKSDYTGDTDPAIAYTVIDGDKKGEKRLYWYNHVAGQVFAYRKAQALKQTIDNGQAEMEKALAALGGIAQPAYSDVPGDMRPYKLTFDVHGLKTLNQILEKAWRYDDLNK